MSRPNNTIGKIRSNAWHLMSLHQQKLWNEVWAGEDILGFDELVQRVYKQIRIARKSAKGAALESIASAMHAIQEFYDIGPNDDIPPIVRPAHFFPEALMPDWLK